MIKPKKYGRFILNYLAVAHLFIAAAAWRMNGIYNEKRWGADDIDLNDFVARGYMWVAVFALVTAVTILLALRLFKSGGKHRA